MKILSRVSDAQAQAIHRQFPLLEKVLGRDSDGGMQKVAISIFDHWLRDESEWHLMDCFNGPERVNRDRKLEDHWAAVFDTTPAFTVRYRGRWPNKAKLVLKRYTSRDGLIKHSKFNARESPSQFLILPELGCIYAAGWDDTNILYFITREGAQPVFDAATRSGLFLLSYES